MRNKPALGPLPEKCQGNKARGKENRADPIRTGLSCPGQTHSVRRVGKGRECVTSTGRGAERAGHHQTLFQSQPGQPAVTDPHLKTKTDSDYMNPVESFGGMLFACLFGVFLVAFVLFFNQDFICIR